MRAPRGESGIWVSSLVADDVVFLVAPCVGLLVEDVDVGGPLATELVVGWIPLSLEMSSPERTGYLRSG